MQLVEHYKLQSLEVCINIAFPKAAEPLAHKSIVQHLEVCQQDVRYSIKNSITVFNDMIRPHISWIVFRIGALSYEQSCRYLSLQSRVIPDGFGQTLCLVTCQGIHGVHDNNLHSNLTTELIAVVAIVKDRVKKTLCLTRASTCSKERWLRGITVLHRELTERLQLMQVWREVGSNLQRNVFALFFRCRHKGSLQRDIWSFEESILLTLDEAIESITDILLFELEGCLDILYY